ncbi:NCS1 nucleoside transporter family [Mycena chlorophos]|uniref:NCS1 nucleoside transporter family n=1 Tax=Mycena chlorophos TaxID=658473 RepID=A0A8H6T468_MYCCL|nr:NCS1 nucleoside transporter family [Mycena chlorophos]
MLRALPESRLRLGDDDDEDEVIVAQRDLLPVPSDARTWNTLHLGGKFLALLEKRLRVSWTVLTRLLDCGGFCQYQVASTAVAAGLAPGPAIAAVFLGHFLVSLACAMTGFVGAKHGINFPVMARMSFGTIGTLVAVVSRAAAAIVWFGTQTFQGGQCVQVMLGAIFPSFKKFPNRLPASAHVTSSQLLSFFIFYLVQLPFLWIPISKLRHLFMLKVVIMPIFGFTLFGWAVGRAHGFGPIFSQPSRVPAGTPIAVVFFSAMSSAIAPKATLALNICDFTRFAKSPKAVVWTNIVSLSIPITLCAVLGVVVTSATEVIYGVSTWNPLEVCELWNNRAAAFFAAFCWALCVLATNISANSTAVGNDLTIIFPRFVNIRRGQYICAVLGLATCPVVDHPKQRQVFHVSGCLLFHLPKRNIFAFRSFLGGYSIFLGPIAGIILSDFYIYRRRKVDILSLYRRQSSLYWYTHGVNLRAVAAYLLGLVPNLPGFAAKVNTHVRLPIGFAYVFSLVWPVGLVVGGSCYLLFTALWPPAVRRAHSETSSLTTSHEHLPK